MIILKNQKRRFLEDNSSQVRQANVIKEVTAYSYSMEVVIMIRDYSGSLL